MLPATMIKVINSYLPFLIFLFNMTTLLQLFASKKTALLSIIGIFAQAM